MVDVDHVWVEAVLNEITCLVEDIGNTTGHTGAEVAAGRAEVDHHAASHVFEGVVTDTFDDGFDTRVADAEALTGHACDVGFTLGRAVEADVTRDDVFVRDEWRFLRRMDDDLRTGEALAEVVVGITGDGEGHALRAEGTE